MKILIICSTLDLKYRLGCTPSWWQLFKALYETGNDVIVVPYLGDPVESPWWRTYSNPCNEESKFYNSFLDRIKKFKILSQYNNKSESFINKFAKLYVRNKWKNFLFKILEKEKDIDAILFINVPINHIQSIPTAIHGTYDIPVAYFDGDMPTILPKYAVDRGFKFNYYIDADLSEFDAFFTNSQGVIPDLLEMGGHNIHTLYYAADPELFKPTGVRKLTDISFYGYGSEFREQWMKQMITEPSQKLRDVNFTIGGGGFNIDLGYAHMVGDVPYSSFREFCCSSKINLNITRWSHTKIYASSTARPFELAACGACIVSQPYNGIEEWFDIGKEIIIVNNEKEIIETYMWLVGSSEDRQMIGERARKRILKDHTFCHRANEITRVLGRRCQDKKIN